MDIEKLIAAVKLCGSTPRVDQCKNCTYWAGGDMSKCIPQMTADAATALSTLQAENEELQKMYQEEKVVCHATQAELERMKKIMRENGIMIISSKYPGSTEKWNIQKPRDQKEK